MLFVSHDEKLLERVAKPIIHLEQLRRRTSCQATTLAMGYGDYCAWREAQQERQDRTPAVNSGPLPSRRKNCAVSSKRWSISLAASPGRTPTAAIC